MEKLKNILERKEFLNEKELVEKYATEGIEKNDKHIDMKLLPENERVKKYDDFVKQK